MLENLPSLYPKSNLKLFYGANAFPLANPWYPQKIREEKGGKDSLHLPPSQRLPAPTVVQFLPVVLCSLRSFCFRCRVAVTEGEFPEGRAGRGRQLALDSRFQTPPHPRTHKHAHARTGTWARAHVGRGSFLLRWVGGWRIVGFSAPWE